MNKFFVTLVGFLAVASTAQETNNPPAVTNEIARAKLEKAEADRKAARSNFIRIYRPLRVINEDELFDFTQVESDLIASQRRPGSFFFDTYPKYIVSGRVAQVVSGGVFVRESINKTVFLINYPKKDSVVDGSEVLAIAVYLHPHQYTSVNGAQRTVPKYDCGRTYDPSKDQFTNKTYITRTGEVKLGIGELDKVPLQ